MSRNVTKGVIRMQIDNFADLQDFDDTVHYKKWKIGNVDWTLLVFTTVARKTDNVKHLSINLCCKPKSRSNLWSCTASIRFSLLKLKSDNPNDAFSKEFDKKFNARSQEIDVVDFMDWEEANCKENGYIMGKNAVLEAHIEMRSLLGIQEEIIEDFSEPNGNLTDVVLVVEGKKVHVGKQILARSSKFFHALFFSDFSENAQSEVTIEDVVHSEFVDFLNLAYSTHKSIDTSNIGHILKLADRFDANAVIGKCEDFLISTTGVHLVDKLQYAETYHLSELQDSCLDQLTTSEKCCEIADHENYKHLGDATYSVIHHKMVEIMNGKANDSFSE